MKSYIEELLIKHKAIYTGHFKLASGKHSDKLIECAQIMQYPKVAQKVGLELAIKLMFDTSPDIVLSPAIGGILIGSEIARLYKSKFIFAEKDANGLFKLKRGFTIPKASNVVIIEDVITSGYSVDCLMGLVKRYEANLLSIGSIVLRDNPTLIDYPITALYYPKEFSSYTLKECPMCKKGVPLTEK